MRPPGGAVAAAAGAAVKNAHAGSVAHAAQQALTVPVVSWLATSPEYSVFGIKWQPLPPLPPVTLQDAGFGTENSRIAAGPWLPRMSSATSLPVMFAGSRTMSVRPIAVPLKATLPSTETVNRRTCCPVASSSLIKNRSIRAAVPRSSVTLVQLPQWADVLEPQ